MNVQRILIVDHEGQMVDKLASCLNEKGFQASSTSTLLPVPNNLRNNYYDLIAFGQSVKQCYEEVLRFNNPGILTLTGISSPAPIVADQVSLALNRRCLEKSRPLSYLNYDINEGRLEVMMMAAKECDVEISLYSIGMFSGTSKNVLLKEVLQAGERFIRFEEKALAGFGAKFMVIRVNNRVYYMQRL